MVCCCAHYHTELAAVCSFFMSNYFQKEGKTNPGQSKGGHHRSVASNLTFAVKCMGMEKQIRQNHQTVRFLCQVGQ